jgi:Zn-dependent peptidase ImmA (M78 family)
VCIAHEIYHLLYEHDLFKEGGSQEWPTGVKTTKLIEDQCNQFAYQLCKLHDEFNKRPDMRKQHIHFPDHTFDKTFNMNNTAWYLDWPAEIMLDSKNPFHKRKAMPQQEKNPPL